MIKQFFPTFQVMIVIIYNHISLLYILWQVGACIVNRDHRIVGIGYNGMPNGCSDDEMPWGKGSNNILNTKKLYGKYISNIWATQRSSADVSKLFHLSGVLSVILYYRENKLFSIIRCTSYSLLPGVQVIHYYREYRLFCIIGCTCYYLLSGVQVFSLFREYN